MMLRKTGRLINQQVYLISYWLKSCRIFSYWTGDDWKRRTWKWRTIARSEIAGREMQDMKLQWLNVWDGRTCNVLLWKAKRVNLVMIFLKFASTATCAQPDLVALIVDYSTPQYTVGDHFITALHADEFAFTCRTYSSNSTSWLSCPHWLTEWLHFHILHFSEPTKKHQKDN